MTGKKKVYSKPPPYGELSVLSDYSKGSYWHSTHSSSLGGYKPPWSFFIFILKRWVKYILRVLSNVHSIFRRWVYCIPSLTVYSNCSCSLIFSGHSTSYLSIIVWRVHLSIFKKFYKSYRIFLRWNNIECFI